MLMAVYLKYPCACFYLHKDDDSIELMHACADHTAQLVSDALANISKRVKLGSSKTYS